MTPRASGPHTPGGFASDRETVMPDPARTLSALSEEFVEVVCRLDPVAATSMGIHDYDERLPNDSLEGFGERMAWLDSMSTRLAALAPPDTVAAAQRVDHLLLR